MTALIPPSVSRVKQITRNRNGCDVKEIFSLQMIYTREGITTDDDPPPLPSPSLAEDINPVWSVCVEGRGRERSNQKSRLPKLFLWLLKLQNSHYLSAHPVAIKK